MILHAAILNYIWFHSLSHSVVYHNIRSDHLFFSWMASLSRWFFSESSMVCSIDIVLCGWASLLWKKAPSDTQNWYRTQPPGPRSNALPTKSRLLPKNNSLNSGQVEANIDPYTWLLRALWWRIARHRCRFLRLQTQCSTLELPRYRSLNDQTIQSSSTFFKIYLTVIPCNTAVGVQKNSGLGHSLSVASAAGL